MSTFNEFSWIKSLPKTGRPELKLGIGDDSAIFQNEQDWAISTDSLVENSHFLSSDDPKLVAEKLVKVNVSDMAAMGCEPKFFLLNLHLSPSWNESQLKQFKVGLFDELKKWQLSLIGGDTITVNQGPIHLVGTILGQPFGKHAIQRKGAMPNDDIFVTGALGGSFPKRHLTFTPRLEWSKLICSLCSPSAMMDLSDGLLQDLGHILDLSKVSAELELQNIPIHDEIKDDKNALSKALSDGEDFELLFTLNPENSQKLPKDLPIQKIGKIIPGDQKIFARKNERDEFNVWPRLGFEHNQTSQN